MNTVKRAQKIFVMLQDKFKDKGYPNKDLMLIHGRFTFADRSRLEGRLPDKIAKENIPPIILVATQIVEVSLDIDYDVMFTEACYPDSLVQRSGRINRRGNLGNNGEGLVRVFLPEGWYENKDKNSLPYDQLLLSASIAIIKDKAPRITSEYDYITITNEFYNKSQLGFLLLIITQYLVLINQGGALRLARMVVWVNQAGFMKRLFHTVVDFIQCAQKDHIHNTIHVPDYQHADVPPMPQGKPIGIKTASWRIPNGVHIEFWYDFTGGGKGPWIKYASLDDTLPGNCNGGSITGPIGINGTLIGPAQALRHYENERRMLLTLAVRL